MLFRSYSLYGAVKCHEGFYDGTVSIRRARVLLNGSCVCDKGFVIATEVMEAVSFAAVGRAMIGVKLNGMFVGIKGLLIAIEAKEAVSLAAVGGALIGVKLDSMFVGIKGLFVVPGFVASIALIYPL